MSIREESAPFNYKISDVQVVWRQNSSLEIQISRVAQGYKPTVTEEDRAKARDGFQYLMTAISPVSVAELSARLKDNGQTVVSTTQNAKTLIRIRPVKGLTECGPVLCTHNLAMEVSVADLASRKEIWRGGFRVGMPVFGELAQNTVDPRIVESFVDSIISALKRERFI